ncbi:hypothetical protein ATW86_09115 [Oenococcus oeni]|nr:hypothetical protein ATW86_09115 [Oenococcus oeni]
MEKMKKYTLLIPLLLSSAVFETSLVTPSFMELEQKTYATFPITKYASITSSTNASYIAVIVEGSRNDGIYISGPALTSVATMTAKTLFNTYFFRFGD